MLFWLICPPHTPTGERAADFFYNKLAFQPFNVKIIGSHIRFNCQPANMLDAAYSKADITYWHFPFSKFNHCVKKTHLHSISQIIQCDISFLNDTFIQECGSFCTKQ